MNPAQLNQRLTIEQKTGVEDDTGNTLDEWQLFKRVWAKLTPQASSETESSDSTQAVTRYQVRIRYRSNVTAAMRLTKGERIFHITAPPINEHGKRRYLLTECEERHG